jgi:hypothetical protein
MEAVSGVVKPRSKALDVGFVDTKRKNVYRIPVNERASVKFRVTSVKIQKAELIVGGQLISVITPKYEGDETEQDLPFLGEARFHRAVIDESVLVEVVITTDEEAIPSVMIGLIGEPVILQHAHNTFSEVVMASTAKGQRELKIVYHSGGCGYLQK